MKNPIIYRILQQGFCLIFCLGLLSSCIREEEFVNNPQGNFEQLWKIIDEQYCFLDYKQIDWDEIHTRYQKLITPNMGSEGLFEVLSEMLYELQDGHVNLASAHNVSYYDAWYQDYPRNFRADLLEDSYLGRASTDYRTAAGLKYKILKDNIGYIRYESFADPVGNGNLDEVLSYLSVCNGLIIDVRDNGGGNATNSARIASRFTNEKILTKVVVLTNRRSFSATNDFVNHMRCLPNVTTIGDKTGGGSGMPFTSELPNGWSVRFSASPHFDAEMNHIEFGIEPDIKADMLQEDELRGKDTLIEMARKLLSE